MYNVLFDACCNYICIRFHHYSQLRLHLLVVDVVEFFGSDIMSHYVSLFTSYLFMEIAPFQLKMQLFGSVDTNCADDLHMMSKKQTLIRFFPRVSLLGPQWMSLAARTVPHAL